MEKKVVNAILRTLSILWAVIGGAIFFVQMYLGKIEYSGVSFLLAWLFLTTIELGSKENGM